jgi:hypothetical protein
MTDRSFESLLDAATPPAGYTFGSGIWLTHDIDHFGLTLGVAAALGGCNNPDPRRRLSATRLLDAKLLVVANWGRVRARPPTSNIELCWGPPGRVQHAKVALLRFDRPRGSPTVRALVTSANLTAGGLGRNLELLVVEDSNGKGDLASGVAAALRRYCKLDDAPAQTRTKMTAALRRIGVTAANQPSLVVDSIDHQSILAQIARLPSASAATALTIIDPGFAMGNYRNLALDLRKTFPAVSAIGVIAQETTDGQLKFPAPLHKELHAAFATEPTYRSVRSDRTLHAKAMSWQGPSGTTTHLGSANLTASGLLGANIELGVILEGPSIIRKLSTRAFTGTPDFANLPASSEPGMPLLIATGKVINQDRREHTVTAMIEIEVHGPKPPWKTWRLESNITGARTLSKWHRDGTRRLLCRNEQVQFDEDNWMVEISAAGKSCFVPVDLTGYVPAALNERHDVEDPLPPTIAALLAGMGAANRPNKGKGEGASASAVDVLAQPDGSLVHKVAKALIAAGGTWSQDDFALALDQLERDGRLTTGERWALNLLVLRPDKAEDPNGYRIAKLLERMQ